ncbi:flavodoxin [Enterococcus sp.]|uniref:flavodoxin n=1 Tax=Enterococcus sp. TaxID=35783 RepID=UPI0029082F96|nr:flavodoxin [Enterococcus sp.]MDU5336719.1 flavodoxin [Enterococcus sp.]
MKKISALFIVILTVLLSACGTTTDRGNANNAVSSEASTERSSTGAKSLLVYFSIPETTKADTVSGASQASEDDLTTGNIQSIAEKIESITQSDILRLEVKEPYPEDYEETVARARKEINQETLPELETKLPDLAPYDTIYLGYPVWVTTVPPPIKTFLDETDLTNKTVALFATHAGYGLGDSQERIEEMIPNNTFVDTLAIEDEEVKNADEVVQNWLSENELIK